MAAENVQAGALPTEPVTPEQRAHLVKAMTVTPQALEHLRQQGMFRARAGGDGSTSIPTMMPDDCCKPDGGTCCPNAK